MGIADKVKEIGEEIKKSASESGIKEKAKCASMIITDTVEKGKKNIENKMEENKKRLEEQRKFIEMLEKNLSKDIENNLINYESAIFNDKSIDEIIEYCNDFYQVVLNIRGKEASINLTFGEKISEKNIAKIQDVLEISMEEEKPLVCYYGGSKDFWILTNQGLYFKIKHPVECEIYSSCIDTYKIRNIKIDEENNFKINDVSVFKVDKNNAYILRKYMNKLSTKNITYSEDEISKEIEEVINEEELTKIKSYFKPQERFIFIAKNYNSKKPNDWIGCTNNKIIISSGTDSSGVKIINEIKYEDIDYIESESVKDAIAVLNMFKESNLEIIFNGNKILVEGLKIDIASQIVEITEKLKKENKKDEYTEYKENDNIIAKIEELARLKDAGILTEEEFSIKKKELLERI